MTDLKSYVNAETTLPEAHQTYYLDGQLVQGDTRTLQELGVKNGDMLTLSVIEDTQRQAPQQGQRQRAAPNGRPMDFSNPDHIESTRRRFLASPAALEQVRQQSPELAQAINDTSRFRAIFEALAGEEQERNRERQEQTRLLNEDPFNIEAQRKIEEIIRQDRVLENLQHAYEHNPEGEPVHIALPRGVY